MKIHMILLLSLLLLCSAHYMPVPGGFAWDECVHFVPSESHVYENQLHQTVLAFPNGTTKVLPPCPYPRKLSLSNNKVSSHAAIDAEGWQSWASFNTPDNSTFTSFLGNFTVPKNPKNPNYLGILYLFIGLQNDDWIPTPSEPTPTPPDFDIIQPVLQFGSTPDGGGQYWAIASWYVASGDNYVASKLQKVNEGDKIFGSMKKEKSDTWSVGAQVVGTSISSNIQVTKKRLVTQPWAFVTLEVYDVGDCTFMPGSNVPFTDMYLETESGAITPTWQTFTGPNNNPCNTKAIVHSAAEVEIDFSS